MPAKVTERNGKKRNRRHTASARRPIYPADADYFSLLRWHLYEHGTRPDGSPYESGKIWTPKEFKAQFPTDNQRAISNHITLKNPKPPKDTASIAWKLFGDNPLYAREGWPENLKRALERLRQTRKGAASV